MDGGGNKQQEEKKQRGKMESAAPRKRKPSM